MLSLIFAIVAVILLCGFRRIYILNGSLDIGPSHSFCKIDKNVWLPRFYHISPRSTPPEYNNGANFVIGQSGENYLFLYDGKNLHATHTVYILSPHLVLISFLLNGILNDVHIIAFGTAVAVWVSVLQDPNFVFFTPLILLCTSFLGVPLCLKHYIQTAGYGKYETSLHISGNLKTQKKFVRPSYLFFSTAALMNELSILLLTMQAVCSFYQDFGLLQVANFLCTCALLIFSIIMYTCNIRDVYKKKKKDIFILLAEIALITIAIIGSAPASQTIHFAITPTYLFPFTLGCIMLLFLVSKHILSIYLPAQGKTQKKHMWKHNRIFKNKQHDTYNYQATENLFSNHTFIAYNDAGPYKKYYLPPAEYEREKEREKRREEEKQQRLKEKEEKEKRLAELIEAEKKVTKELDEARYIKLRENYDDDSGHVLAREYKEKRMAVTSLELKKVRIQLKILELRDGVGRFNPEWDSLKHKEITLESEYERLSLGFPNAKELVDGARDYRRKHATMWFNGKLITPEEYDEFCKRYGYDKYAKKAESDDDVKKKEKEGGYVNDIDTQNATDRFNNRR